jgi:serine/threonine-protein kinase
MHPHIVAVYDAGEHDSTAYIVMALYPGGTVGQRLRQGPIAQDLALHWLEHAASGLDHAHAQGVVHRDVKPGNLLLDEHDRLAVGDFGIATAAWEASVTQAGMVLGTMAYLSPEQRAGRRATAASDRYALAVVAHELLAGRRPTADPATNAEPLAPEVAAVIEAGMAEDPARRPGVVRRARGPPGDRRGRRGRRRDRGDAGHPAPPPEPTPRPRPRPRAAAVPRRRPPGRPCRTRTTSPSRRRARRAPARRGAPAAHGRRARWSAGQGRRPAGRRRAAARLEGARRPRRARADHRRRGRARVRPGLGRRRERTARTPTTATDGAAPRAEEPAASTEEPASTATEEAAPPATAEEPAPEPEPEPARAGAASPRAGQRQRGRRQRRRGQRHQGGGQRRPGQRHQGGGGTAAAGARSSRRRRPRR